MECKKVVLEATSWFSFWYMQFWLQWNGLSGAMRHLRIEHGDYGIRWRHVQGKWLIVLYKQGDEYYIHQYGDMSKATQEYLSPKQDGSIYQENLTFWKRIKAAYDFARLSPIARDFQKCVKYAMNFRTMRRLRKVGEVHLARRLENNWLDGSASDGFTGWRWERPENANRRRIVTAANRYGNIVIVGVRHHCKLMHLQASLVGLDLLRLHSWSLGNETFEEQGFIDNFGEYLDRESSMVIARAREQFHGYHEVSGSEETLFSEHLH